MVWLIISLAAILVAIFVVILWRFITKPELSTKLSPLSSKIKNLCIELHNYTFFHSPEGSKKAYDRYIGRVKLREKLKTILTNSETRSGAYLVTGFRGMGKTSLVRKAISEIKGNHYYALSRHLRLYLATAAIYLFHSRLPWEVSWRYWPLTMFLLPLSFLAVVYLTYHDNNRPNLKSYYDRKYIFYRLAWVFEAIKSAIRILDLEVDYHRRSKFKAILQDLVIVTVKYILFIWFISKDHILDKIETYDNLINLLYISITYFSIIYFLNNYQLEKLSKPKRSAFTHLRGAIARIFTNAIKRLDFGNKVAIEISLSQDDLKEIDILKLLTKKIYSEYRNLRNRIFTPNRLILPVVRFAVVYLIVGTLFYFRPIYQKINEFRLNSPIIQYFPSQAYFPFVKDSASIPNIKNLAQVDSSRIDQYIVSVNTHIRKNHHEYFGYSYPELELTPTVEVPKKGGFRHLVILVDFTIQEYYQKFFSTLVDRRQYKKNIKIAKDFRVLPARIDYFFIGFLFFLLLAIALLERSAWRFGLINHRYVLQRLKFLNENLSAQIVQEKGQGTQMSGGGVSQVFNFFSRKSRTYPIAGVREIENELIAVLNEIDRIPNISARPEFIFIFDELDKIEAQFNTNIQDKEKEELNSFSNDDEGYFSTESVRKRQETIARILGNLKLFFNTARAKFIFIAGREMYDASLADISDRESFISSIFHEILYVDSFFKDPGTSKGNSITSTTEEFVCQLLLPKFSNYNHNLKGYNEYLKDNFSRNNDPTGKSIKKWINKRSNVDFFDIEYVETKSELNERRKVINIISQFITFLTYRGNGAPKKITKLLEGFIESTNSRHLNDPNTITVGRNSDNLYLYFDYTCQYRLGLTNHLFKPYLIANSGHIRDFGDKMLIATSFLMDHIYKYHKVGFSWENLELTPEIIAINKSPELRRFISRLIDFMATSHIEEIINGLHQFKFTIRIAAEIKYISTISEVEAAAFNFTLDESLLLKRHYRKKLKSISNVYKEVRANSTLNVQHINSIAYINTVLADLHFYDREYDEALIYYNNAGQYLFHRKHEDLQVDEFIFLIRHLLKVGLTQEKTKDYDSAFLSYGKVTHMIRDFYRKHSIKRTTKNRVTFKEEKSENLQLQRKLLENIRLIFEPLLAQFQVIEKGGPNGVTSEDVVRVIDEFKLIITNLESKEKFLIETEFFNKLGDVLYYKNGALSAKSPKKDDQGYFSTATDIKAERTYLQKNLSFKNDFGVHRDYKAPISAWKLYVRSATVFASRITDLEQQNHNNIYELDEPKADEALAVFLKYLKGGYHPVNKAHMKANKQSELLIAAASNLSDMSDTLICFLEEKDQFDWTILENVLSSSIVEGREGVFSEERILDRLTEHLNRNPFDIMNRFDQIIFLLFLANQYFLRAGDYYRSLFQIKKILILIKRYLEFGTSDRSITNYHFDLIKTLAKEAMEMADQSTKNTRRQEIYEFESYFDLNHESPELISTYADSIINHPEGKEILIAVKEIELRVVGADITSILKKNRLATPYTMINNKYNRLFELTYKCSLNREVLTQIRKSAGIKGDDNLKNQDELLKTLILNTNGLNKSLDFDTPEDLLIYLISDSIYCYMEIIRTFNVFGVTFISSHSSNGLTHENLGIWCNYYQTLKKQSLHDYNTALFVKKLEIQLIELLGDIDGQYLDIGYHYKLAIQHLYSVLETHNGGKAYHRSLEEMYYLDDDFDDNLSHFCAAIERYRINTGFIRKKIVRMKDRMKEIDEYNIKDLI